MVIIPSLARGITPAWAGKSFFVAGLGTSTRDHPRVGGEKLRMRVSKSSGLGSPPRGRGKEKVDCAVQGLTRITPAWAGKSWGSACQSRSPWDHPRVGGEKR